jgi:hypothetical protein
VLSPDFASHALESHSLNLSGGNVLVTKRSPDEFRRDIDMRQRNLVYPDTLRNEARGWPGLMTSKEPLSIVQVVGMLIMLLGLPSVMVKLALTQFHHTPGTGLTRLVAGFGGTSFTF